MKKHRSIIWFRNDLRLHDNEALIDAIQQNSEVICAYIFDERLFFGETSFGFPKTGIYRAKFILDSVLDLKKSLQKLGSDLYVRIGKPEEEIYQLAKQMKTSWVYCNRERTKEEVDVQNNLEQKLWSIGQELRYYRGKMLLYTADLPFPINQTPDTFTTFRKEVENFVPIRKPYNAPTEIFEKITSKINFGELPSLDQLGYHDALIEDNRTAFPFKGGETEALKRLNYYLWETKSLKVYKETRNGLLGADYSSKFSPFLALGCLSPKFIYHEIKSFEQAHGSNDSTYWLIFELLWRDFFRFMGKKHGNKIFYFTGTRGKEIPQQGNHDKIIQKWIDGETGIPFIDANMRELKYTGFMSNRGRQNVASFFVKDLKQNWLIGAEYFESQLIDYDPCSNYGNWNYVAGVGSDPRQDRYFSIPTQSKRYDPDGKYMRTWLPEISEMPTEFLHEPDRYSSRMIPAGHQPIGNAYPKPIVRIK
jgi:deoxyribodipyrimidine photo-lyase